MTFTPRKIYDATGNPYYVAAQPLPSDQGDAQVVLLVDETGAALSFAGPTEVTPGAGWDTVVEDGVSGLATYAAQEVTALQIMDDWDDADRAKISSRLIKSTITDTTVDSTADLIFDASGDTEAVELTISNPATTVLYVGEDSSVTTSDFMYYIPPKQTIVISHAGNTGTTEDLYGIRDAGNSGLCKVYSRKYK